MNLWEKLDEILASEQYNASAQAQKMEDEVSFEDGAFLRGVQEGLIQARILIKAELR